MENNKKKGFDEIMKDLTTLIEKLEKGNLPLEEAIRTYEEGVSLLRMAEKFLKDAEMKVEMLIKDKGEITPFIEEEEKEKEG